MSIISVFLFIYLLLKPYYLFSSGGIQISDVFLMIALLFLMLLHNNKKYLKEEFVENKLFIIFIFFTFIINGIYFLIYGKFKFLLSSIYYVFNFIAIIIFSIAFKNNKEFIKKFDKIIKFNLIIQCVIYLLHIGKYFDSTRYMGTFNDPNQFGYYVLISFAYINLFNYKLKNKPINLFIYFILSSFLIILSGSTGMLFGIFIMTVLKILNFFKNISKYVPNIILALVFLIPLIVLILLLFDIDFANIENLSIYQRLSEKINKVVNYDQLDGNSYSELSIFEERGYDKIFIYPKYILYGAGEGEYGRFKLAATINEIHATLPSILFYYGMLPTSILLMWLYSKLKKIKAEYLFIYIALLTESFTLLNQRQALFWVIFAIAPLFIEKEKVNESQK